MFGKAKDKEFQCLEKLIFGIPVFKKAEIHNSNVWKRKSTEFQCLEMPNFTIPMFRKAQTREFQCLE